MGIRSAVGAPIVVAGRLWGAVIAACGRPFELPADAEERITGSAQLMTDALANADAREQLAASRARILQAGYEERRRLGRDLHDGAQQELVNVVIDLQLAQKRWHEDPERARGLVDDALEHAQAAIDDLRALATGIHPAVLTDRGLTAALETLANRSPVPVELDADLDERLPMPVETTAYFVVAEALTNVGKYSAATHAHVTVRREGEQLEVEVRDDGIGGADASAGVGPARPRRPRQRHARAPAGLQPARARHARARVNQAALTAALRAVPLHGPDSARRHDGNGREGGQHGVDDALGETRVERAAAEHQAVVERPEQQLVDQLTVGVGPQVAALDPAVDEAVHLGDARRDHLFAEAARELGVRGEVGDEPLHHAPHQRRAEDPHRGAHEHDELVARVVEVRGRDELLDHVDQHREGQLVLGAPAPVDRGLGHTRARGDALDRQTVHAALREQLAGGVEDRCALVIHATKRSVARTCYLAIRNVSLSTGRHSWHDASSAPSSPP